MGDLGRENGNPGLQQFNCGLGREGVFVPSTAAQAAKHQLEAPAPRIKQLPFEDFML